MSPATVPAMIEVRGLAVSYGNIRAVQGIDLDVARERSWP